MLEPMNDPDLMPIHPEQSSCENSVVEESADEYHSCLSPTALEESEVVEEEQAAPKEEEEKGREEVPLCSRGFVIFNVVFALMMVLLMYLVIVVCAKEGING
ncbi:hypothetical protein WA588_006168 [Blastocystis sp. NMH]